MSKRLLSLFLMFCILLVTTGCNKKISDQEQDLISSTSNVSQPSINELLYCENTFIFEKSSQTIMGLTESGSQKKAIVIPEKMHDISVKKIAADAFQNCHFLNSITIPSCVVSICDHAFDKFHQLTIYGYEDTEAERYANLNHIPFQDIFKINGCVIKANDVKMYRNGKINSIMMNENNQYAQLRFLHDIAMIPIQYIAELNDIQVDWIEDTYTVQITNNKDHSLITAIIGERKIQVCDQNGNSKELIAPEPFGLYHGIIYVPLRFTYELLGGYVHYENRYNHKYIALSSDSDTDFTILIDEAIRLGL